MRRFVHPEDPQPIAHGNDMIPRCNHRLLEVRGGLGHGSRDQRTVGLRCLLDSQKGLVQQFCPLQRILFHERLLQQLRHCAHFLAPLFESELDIAAEIAARQSGEGPVAFRATGLAFQRADVEPFAQSGIQTTGQFRLLSEGSDRMSVGHGVGDQRFEPTFVSDAEDL